MKALLIAIALCVSGAARSEEVGDEAEEMAAIRQDVRSAQICVSRSMRKYLLDQIAIQKKYARRVGVKDDATLIQFSRRLKFIEDNMGLMTLDMRNIGLTVQSCGRPQVKTFASCIPWIVVGEREPIRRSVPEDPCSDIPIQSALHMLYPEE